VVGESDGADLRYGGLIRLVVVLVGGGVQDAGRGSSLRAVGGRQRHLSDAQQPVQRHCLLLRRRRLQRVRQQSDVRRRALSHARRLPVHAAQYATASVCLSVCLSHGHAKESMKRSSVRPSVRPCVCPIDRQQQQRRAASLLLSALQTGYIDR